MHARERIQPEPVYRIKFKWRKSCNNWLLLLLLLGLGGCCFSACPFAVAENRNSFLEIHGHTNIHCVYICVCTYIYTCNLSYGPHPCKIKYLLSFGAFYEKLQEVEAWLPCSKGLFKIRKAVFLSVNHSISAHIHWKHLIPWLDNDMASKTMVIISIQARFFNNCFIWAIDAAGNIIVPSSEMVFI